MAMKNSFIIIVLLALLACCTSKEQNLGRKSEESQPSDTLYTEKAAMGIYGTQPERALQIIDSAELLGNLTEVRAEFLRARVYSNSIESLHFDSAILIAERLMQNEEVLADPNLKENVLEVLLNACRLDQDFEQGLYWATQLRDSYRERNKKTEALRIEAEIGTLLVNVGQQEEGMARIDRVILQLDILREPKSFNNLDASIIALKRKVEACFEMKLYDTTILTAQRMLELLCDYEEHPAEFHDGNYREPSDEKRPSYIDFYRGKAYGYIAKANALLHEEDEARKYIALFDQTFASQSLTSRFMIAPVLGKVGEYERMLAIYDEVEQRLGNDTLNEYYAEVLLERAKAAKAQNKSNLYAARFQAQRQQLEIEQEREATRKAEYKDKYRELKPAPNSELQTPNYSELSDADLFNYLRDLIEREQLFLDPNFERQTLIDRTGLTKERIGAAFAQGSEYERLTTLVRELRLNHAVRLLNEQPELTIEQVCLASGFTNTVSFNRSFKAKYGMTPSEFRGTKAQQNT